MWNNKKRIQISSFWGCNSKYFALTRSIIILAIMMLPIVSYSFVEDLCVYKVAPHIRNCMELPNVCYDVSYLLKHRLMYKKCMKFATKARQKGNDVLTKVAYRSMIHSDATYFIAKVLGFSSQNSRTIAKYDEAADSGQFIPFSINGNLLLSRDTLHKCALSGNFFRSNKQCKLTTRDVNGVGREDVSTGGTMFHYGSQFSVNENNLKWNPNDPSQYNRQYLDPLSYELKRFVFNSDSSKHNPICAAGVKIHGKCPKKNVGYILQSTAFDFQKFHKLFLGPQILYKNGSKKVYFNQIASYVYPENGPLAALGLYLHHQQDIYSHHICYDNSKIIKTSNKKNKVVYKILYSQYCSPGYHFLWHAWEVGEKQSKVPSVHKTIHAALNSTYSILSSYLQFHHISNNIEKLNKDKMINELIKIMGIHDAKPRTVAMRDLFKKYKLTPPVFLYGDIDRK